MSEVKISELEETTTVQEGCCFPIVTQGVTKKISYGTLADKLETIIEPEWNKIKNKPSTYAPSAHTHEQSDIAGLGTALNNKQDKLTAGSGITIENNVISATGGGTGGGAVDSVNGKTGTVVLTASDVGAVATETGKGLSSNDYSNTEKQNNANNTSARHTHSNKTILDNTTASYTTEEKNKLAGLNNYTLPTASADTLGGVKVGAGLSVTNGVLSATGGGVADSVEWENVQNKPSVYPPSAHTHIKSEITDFPAIPTKTSDLQNDSGFITGYTETDPTVPSHVKSITNGDIDKWNNKSDFSGSYNDLNDKPAIPSKTSDLINDSNFVADSNYTHTDNNYNNADKNKLAGIAENANNYSLPTASETVLGGVKVGSGLSINNGVLSATSGSGTGNVSSDTINSIVVVDELPEVEVEGVLYLVKEPIVPTVENLYPDQAESTQSDGFTVTFKDKNVIVNGSNSSTSVWGWTQKFNMNLEANKTYYLQLANVSGSFDDSQRIANSDGVVTNVSLSAFDSSNNETQLISQVERTASGVYDKYVFTPTQVYNKFSVSLQVKKLNVFDNWKCLITIAEKVGE